MFFIVRPFLKWSEKDRLASTFLANQATNTMAIVLNAEYCPNNDAAGLESTLYIDNTFSPNRMAVKAETARR